MRNKKGGLMPSSSMCADIHVAEGLYSKPLRVFLRFAALVLPSFRGGDGELCDGHTLLAALHLGVTAEISDQQNLLHGV
jgi:hypothetical protein